MNLHHLLNKRTREKGPLRVGLIGAGKFGSMYLAQAGSTEGVHLAAIADLDPARALAALGRTGWPAGQGAASSLPDVLSKGTTFITADASALIEAPGLDVLIDATGSPSAGIAHVLSCCRRGKHIIMVNVEADALAGPLLARRAEAAGIIYSLAYGDQPALICELVDWARACGFAVVAAGKGTKYLPVYHQSTPDTVWRHYGFTEEQLATGDFNAKMFNSFLDGEGGFTVYGTLLPARRSLASGLLPIGLAHGVTVKRPVAAGQTIMWADVACDERNETVKFRREMEAVFKKEWSV